MPSTTKAKVIEPQPAIDNASQTAEPAPSPVKQTEPERATPAAPPRTTKQALVLNMLKRKKGVTLNDLAAATGWLPHTTRAALTVLRKKSHAIVSEKADGVTRYRIAA